MKVLVCGGRDYTDKMCVWHTLNCLGPPEGTEIISGAARGADTFAAEWARLFDSKLSLFPADWTKYGKAAGMIRNKQMLVEGKPDLVVAFPGGKGTAGMVSLAEKAGVPVVKIGT